MLHKAALTATTILLASSGLLAQAHAKSVTYTLTMASFCDVVVLTVDDGFITGTDVGCVGIYPSTPYFIGSSAKIPSTVAPGGSVLSVASDFGITANNVQLDSNLKTLNAVFYGNDSGSLFTNASAFTYTKGEASAAQIAANANKPSMMAGVLARRAQH
jgi:hypothetical protein